MAALRFLAVLLASGAWYARSYLEFCKGSTMRNTSIQSFIDLFNMRQHLRELDTNIHDNADMLGIYSREFRMPVQQNDRHANLTR